MDSLNLSKEFQKKKEEKLHFEYLSQDQYEKLDKKNTQEYYRDHMDYKVPGMYKELGFLEMEDDEIDLLDKSMYDMYSWNQESYEAEEELAAGNELGQETLEAEKKQAKIFRTKRGL